MVDPANSKTSSDLLPAGTVTFLFSDIEGSTELLATLGDSYAPVLADQRRILRSAFQRWNGHEVDTQGDAFFVAFASARDAVAASLEAQRAIAGHAWPGDRALRVRMAVHTGEAAVTAEGYVGLDVHRAARICAAGHGGQVLLSPSTCALVQNDLPAGITLRDLGEHRLKDLPDAMRLHQLAGPGLLPEFPPLRTLDALPGNLPLQLTSFLGRREEVALLEQKFPGTRLLTLIGPGGTGKTRLALRTAAGLQGKYAHGVFFIDLTSLNDPALLPGHVAEVLAVKELKTEPILESVKRFLERKSILLVLDNMEHVLGAALAVQELVAAGPGVDVLVTSREVLHVSSEQVYAVPPLSLPPAGTGTDPMQLASSEAMQLFDSRARAAHSDFRITPENAGDIAEICRRLDGLPLAIELAAARVRLFTPKKLLARLSDRLTILTGGARDRHVRQQTLRGAIDWSYALLEPAERKLFARLEVFSGGRSLEAVETVCTQGLEIDVLAGLESLLDKSLIRQEEDFEQQPRFVMLESLQAYARERHREFEDWQATLAAHAEWVLSLAQAGEEGIFGEDSSVWVNRLKTEESNIRAVLERCQAGQLAPEVGVRLAGALRYYWESTGKLREGLHWLNTMLSLASDLPRAVRAKAQCGAGVISYWRGDWQQGATHCQEALEAGRELGDRVIVGEAQHFLAHVAQNQGNSELGLKLLTESHRSFLAIGHSWGIQRSRICLADAQRLQQDYDRAAQSFEEAIREQQKKPEDAFVSVLLCNYGNVLNRQGKYSLARAQFLQGIRHGQTRDNPLFLAYLVVGLAGNTVLAGDPAEATLLLGAAAGLFAAAGISSMAAIDQVDHDFYLEQIRANLEPERFDALWEVGRAMSAETLVAHVLSD